MYAVGALTWAVIVSIDQNTRTLISVYTILDTRLSAQCTPHMPDSKQSIQLIKNRTVTVIFTTIAGSMPRALSVHLSSCSPGSFTRTARS